MCEWLLIMLAEGPALSLKALGGVSQTFLPSGSLYMVSTGRPFSVAVLSV